ncbi:hypothetical protein PHSY_006784 [Pseudozyma hubeiensis SY62]|uniref:Uncharacterized protein n=1 Tax=Pseudozyma hubeiensis (strain SY62) TaxID=1305764 RepID=R9PCU5_PSEHS|nr:hypothetical protein PHSY_006784 [Pseudozyma hubeiensis SY62]GAC99184.1 hypothetical protein PHSY_006784 [Pseudozyma hubeiensis SY62]
MVALSLPSTSAKTLDGISNSNHLNGPRFGSPLSNSSPLRSSPLQTRSSPVRNRSPLRRALDPRSDDFASSSDESDASDVVFFGKPSSAEKKKRIHYEQRVLEKRLKHKDSLDLARRRPISFNPDDTMLFDDQRTNSWAWSQPTPTSRNSTNTILSSPIKDPAFPSSPSGSDCHVRTSSPVALTTPTEAKQLVEEESVPSPGRSGSPGQSAPRNFTERDNEQCDLPHSPQKDSLDSPSRSQGALAAKQLNDVNPFQAAQTSLSSAPAAKTSPSKEQMNSTHRTQSPVRSVETLIGATMAQNKEYHSPMRSPRRSPRLSLRALQLSTSPTKVGSVGLLSGLSTPFQQPVAKQQTAPQQHSTPFRQSASALLIPPSTGLSRFACLQNLSPINARVPETPANRALSIRLAHHSILPSPFISSAVLEPHTVAPSGSPSRGMRTASPAKHVASPQKHDSGPVEPLFPLPSSSRENAPVKGAATLATPSVRFAIPEASETPSKAGWLGNVSSLAIRTPSPSKAPTAVEESRSIERASPVSQRPTSPMRHVSHAAALSPSTPPATVANAKPETPVPVFRQTARRVPIHQHEADFGVKVSPEKPSYSPRRVYSNSSARNTEFAVKHERIPARRVQVHGAAAARQISTKQGEGTAPATMRVASVASKAARAVSSGTSRIGSQGATLPAAALARAPSSSLPPSFSSSAPRAALSQPAARAVPSMQGSSVASKASRQRLASAALAARPNSPSRQARPVSGLPRPRSAQAAGMPASTSGPGSRLPRPASTGPSASTAKATSRPLPMAIARLAPSQQGTHRAPAASSAPRTQGASSPSESSPVDSSPVSGAWTLSEDNGLQATQVVEDSSEVDRPASDANCVSPSISATAQAKHATEPIESSDLRRQASASSLRGLREAHANTQPGPAAQTHQVKTARMISPTSDAIAVRSSSPIKSTTTPWPPSSARSAPPVVLDPEQQRLRCLAMQEKARNRTPKGASSTGVSASSEMEEIVNSEDNASGSSPIPATIEPAFNAGPAFTAAEALAAKHAEAVDAVQAPSAGVNATANTPSSSTALTTGRPLRSARAASRPLAPSATRVPPSRGRALSLNDIIAARKIDVPLSLTDQLKLADSVNKKHNEKTLARYKITKVQRPYERPPSPDRHDHEPEACTIIDDVSNHRQGKGDLAPYSTPTKSSTNSARAPADGRKSVRWYRPLFVGKGAQYGLRACESKPALKPIRYELDRMGNKMATGCSPKLSKGQSIVIYRNYFKGEPEPADD